MNRHYLIAEDDHDTRVIIEAAFKRLDLAVHLHWAKDGQMVIDYLEGNGEFAARATHPLPALVLLDLKMPFVSGMDALRWIRKQKTRIQQLLVVMFSSSDQESDVIEAYREGVNSFVHKPASFAEMMHVLSSIHHYWFACNFFPDPTNGIVGKHRSEFHLVKAPP